MTSPSSPEEARRLALAYVDACNTHDCNTLRQITSTDLGHHVLPRSLGPSAARARTQDEWLELMDRYLTMIPDFAAVLHGDVLAGEGFACFHASSSGTTTSGLPYRNEYAFTLRVATSSSGEAKITSIEEFCDSATLGAFFSQMASASTS